MSDASAGSFMVTLDLTASGGSVQTSGEIVYNADATGGRTSVQGVLEVKCLIVVILSLVLVCEQGVGKVAGGSSLFSG